MNYSKLQLAIFDFIEHGKGHALVEAKAGSGKTFTVKHSLQYINPCERAILFAFNKHIAEELKNDIPVNVQSSTINAYGHGLLREAFGFVKVNKNKTKNLLLYEIFKIDDLSPADQRKAFKYIRPVCQLVSLFKSHNYASEQEAAFGYDALCRKYGVLEPDNLDLGQLVDIASRTFSLGLTRTKVIDFDDQLLLPVIRRLIRPRFDWVFVDEAQDLNPVQIEFIKILGSKGRIVAVGDTNQAIYGFRGADPMAMANIKEALQAVTLPLSICYRCPKSVVRAAQAIVPDIEPSDTAIGGSVTNISESEFPARAIDGDYVLCRTTAPLVSWCMKFIRKGVKATVKGRDIGESLIELITSLGPLTAPVEQFVNNLERYRIERVERLKKLGRDEEIVSVEDRADTLLALLEDCSTLQEVVDKISKIFQDEVEGIVFCTVHRAKGLEADNIFILHPELMPHPKCKQDWQLQQESNLKYVAITRAMVNLYWVTNEKEKPGKETSGVEQQAEEVEETDETPQDELSAKLKLLEVADELDELPPDFGNMLPKDIAETVRRLHENTDHR